MIARYDIEDVEGNWTFEDIPLHSCTEDDWAKFYEFDKEAEIVFNAWANVLNAPIKDYF